MWEKELAAKLAEKDALYREYHAPKDDTAKIEKIQRSVNEILHSETDAPERSLTWTWGIAL